MPNLPTKVKVILAILGVLVLIGVYMFETQDVVSPNAVPQQYNPSSNIRNDRARSLHVP